MKRKEFIKFLGVSCGVLAVNWSCKTKFLFIKEQTIAFIGDSITQKGGYIEYLKKYLDENYNQLNLNLVNLGLSSETVSGLSEPIHDPSRPLLFNRLDRILEENKPDVVFFYYGINDGIYHPFLQENFERYRAGVQRFLTVMQRQNIKVVLMTPTPFYLSEEAKIQLKQNDDGNYSYKTPYYNYDESVIVPYKNYILSLQHPVVIKKIDLYNAVMENADTSFGVDPIHPISKGHECMAKAIIKAIE